MAKETLLPGEVLAFRLADGRYAAVRAVRQNKNAFLVYECDYLEDSLPSLEDPRLRRPVIRRRARFDSEPAIFWVDGAPPRAFERLGTLPVTKKDAAMDSNTYAGRWQRIGQEAFREWRWIHDRAGFEADAQRSHQELLRRFRAQQKRKTMMDEEAFWSIIGLLRWRSKAGDEAILEPAIAKLSTLPVRDIRQFAERVAYQLYQLDTQAHAAALEDGGADGFLYARCAVVASGRRVYERGLAKPKSMPRDREFESLLGLASAAYERKTGREFEYTSGCSYESFSNAAGWPEA